MQPLIIPEYEKVETDINLFEHSKYVDKIFNKNRERISLGYGKIKNRGPWAGIIELDEDIRLQFQPKVNLNMNFFRMLSYLNDLDSFIYDPKKTINVKNGGPFLDLISQLFIYEFIKIEKKGFLKKYLNKEENKKFLKGKLMLKKQIQQNSCDKSNFYCSYNDLTFNNLENQTVFFVSRLLKQLSRNKCIKIKLGKIQDVLLDEVEYIKISQSDLLKINFNRVNEHYSKIIEICNFVLKKVYAKNNLEKQDALCFNFIVNMNSVYEDFITRMLQEIFEENYFERLELIPQFKNKLIIKEGKKYNLKPDLVIKDKDSGKIIILDVKYKEKNISNSDFYQIAIYSQAFQEKDIIKGILLYENYLGNENYTKLYRSFNQDGVGEGEILIEYKSLNLASIMGSDFLTQSEFEGEIKGHLKKIINSILVLEDGSVIKSA
jgi:5-methylcytosine-specific restriction enzyme subunit McrC